MVQKKGPKSSIKKKRPLQQPMGSDGNSTFYEENVHSHKHCFNCGISIQPDRDSCSERCQVEWDKMLKKKKFWNYLPLLGAGFLALLWIIMSLA